MNTKTVPNDDGCLGFRYHKKGVSNQVSSDSDHEIKCYSCSNFSTKMEKNEKGEKFSELQNRAIRKLQIGVGLRNYKSGGSRD